MDAGVVESDDLAVDRDGVGDVDGVLEDGSQPDGDGCFSVSGGAIEQDGAAAGHGWAGLLNEHVCDDEIFEGSADAGVSYGFVGEFLAMDLLVEVVDRYWSGSGIAAPLECVAGLAFAFLGEGVADVAEVFCVTAGCFKEMAVDGDLDEFGDEMRSELDGVFELRDGVEAFDVDELEEEGEEFRRVDAGFFQGAGFFGDAVEECLNGFTGSGADGDQMIAETAAVSHLTCRSDENLVFCDQSRTDQHFAQARLFHVNFLYLRSKRTVSRATIPLVISLIELENSSPGDKNNDFQGTQVMMDGGEGGMGCLESAAGGQQSGGWRVILK